MAGCRQITPRTGFEPKQPLMHNSGRQHWTVSTSVRSMPPKSRRSCSSLNLSRRGQTDLAAEGSKARIVLVAQDEGVEEEVQDA